MCPAYKICWGNGSTELVVVTKHWFNLKPTPPEGACLWTLPGWPRTGKWIAQRPRMKSNTTGKKSIKWFHNAYRSVPCSVVSREVSGIRWELVLRSTLRYYAKRESIWKVSTGSLPLEFRESHRRWRRKIVRVRGDRGHQENMALLNN